MIIIVTINSVEREHSVWKNEHVCVRIYDNVRSRKHQLSLSRTVYAHSVLQSLYVEYAFQIGNRYMIILLLLLFLYVHKERAVPARNDLFERLTSFTVKRTLV